MLRFLAVAVLAAPIIADGDVWNLKVVTDASPDYSDMESMVHSITSKWETPEEKCRAMFYWNHIARRQTAPMMLHGFALTDPIRQFNDYGYTMCSTISGINCAIWDAMGLKAKYWDISNHTVAEVEFAGGWHMFDNSLSALYTLCDGKTLAGVADIGQTLACEASGGKSEPGHIAKYHCLTATSKNGFLTGSDTARSLEEEYRCFNPNGLKYRSYFYDWDRGHRYILNVRAGEKYLRHYASLGSEPRYYVPNNGKDPDAKGKFKQRGNGVRTFSPALTAESFPRSAHSFGNVRAANEGGIEPVQRNASGEIIFKVEGANVITDLTINADLFRAKESDIAELAVSTTNGLSWRAIWKHASGGDAHAQLDLVDEVNGSYEVLVKVALRSEAKLKAIDFTAHTQLNAKTQPKLNIGKNAVCVSAGPQTESIVVWPDLEGGKAAPYIVEKRNVAFAKKNPGYMGTLSAERANEAAWVVFRIDAPRDITRINYGGRFYNRAPKSHIALLHSFDGGKSWSQSYSLTDTQQPWDVIHYETVTEIPKGTRSVLFKYLLNGSAAGSDACSIYAVRMEANHERADARTTPLEVTFAWSEVQADRTLVERSHTQHLTALPAKYNINVGGADHPIMRSLQISAEPAGATARSGYSDGKDAGGEKFVPRKITIGRNLAEGKKYTLSVPSETNWDAGDPGGRKLTDGVAGPSFAGGTSYRYGALWSANKNPVIIVDLGDAMKCASFGLNFHGYPWHDALKGDVKDNVEVLVSTDGSNYRQVGTLQTDLRRRDIPVNFMLPDDESLTGATFRCLPPAPMEARYVQFKVRNRRVLDVTEIEVLDAIQFEPFDLRIALPDEKGKAGGGSATAN
jgi:hypothetical protein